MYTDMINYRLTEYSHGAGCGCKLSPAVLQEILQDSGESPEAVLANLMVGHDTRDDAAVVVIDGATAIVSTTDFFMPIVDDPRDFGAIAATNAISDIYAMGAAPLMAIAILGWPIDKIPPSVAGEVLRGAREVCSDAGIPLAGGHSIDAPEPIFGLAVTGQARVEQIKRNESGKNGDLLFLTKPLGIGLVTTAQKKKLASEADLQKARASMLTLNSAGRRLGQLDYVHALTDVTGFGLAGHLLEVCESAGLAAELYMDQIPRFEFVGKYLELGCIPGGTHRNWKAYGHKVELAAGQDYALLADPQTSGGLLISVDPTRLGDFKEVQTELGLDLEPIGRLTAYDHAERLIVKG